MICHDHFVAYKIYMRLMVLLTPVAVTEHIQIDI